MRAIYIKNFECSTKTSIEGDSAHHLLKVVRVKVGQELLILNGLGGKFFSKVTHIEKKLLGVEILKSEKVAKKLTSCIDIALCLPKKEAFLDMIKQATELGVSSVIPVVSQFSQLDITKDEKLCVKILKCIESAMIQSNNPFTLKVCQQIKLNELSSIAFNYQKIIYLSSRELQEKNSQENSTECGKTLIIIGPEAGLNESEESLINNLDNCSSIHLPTYILRAPTALNVAVGYLLGRGL